LLGDGKDEVDIEQYWERVETNLRNRRVRLIFVADSTPRELRRLVEFLNEEMVNVEVLAVEIKQFQREDDKGQKALVPRVVGLTESARSVKELPRRRRTQWSEERFFQVLSENVESNVVVIVRDLYTWSQDVADRIWFGTGTQMGSFTFHYPWLVHCGHHGANISDLLRLDIRRLLAALYVYVANCILVIHKGCYAVSNLPEIPPIG